jgi:cytochrome c oxidase subunit 3
VAISITAIQKSNKKLALSMLWITLFFAVVFLVNKYFEWSLKIEHGIFPGMEHYNSLPMGGKMFFFLYYFMTGLHALHVIVGGIILGFVMNYIKKDKITHDNFVLHENGGLYWHLVDLIWIYLFPLFYLIH